MPLRDRRAWVSALVSLLALAAAVGAALATGAANGGPVLQVERVSGRSATVLQAIATALPVGYAFGAGMVAAVNPCGFALLPAYLGLYLGLYLGAGGTGQPGSALPRALLVGVVVTASFVLLFGAAGIVLSAIGSALTASFPWIGLAVGVLLILVAGRMLAGRPLHTPLSDRLADLIGRPARRSDLWGYAAFGLAYGLASLGCTLPVFLAVVGGSLVVHASWPDWWSSCSTAWAWASC